MNCLVSCKGLFHVHVDISNLVVGVMLAQNPTEECDQPIAYTS
jgi:hypothetical protein